MHTKYGHACCYVMTLVWRDRLRICDRRCHTVCFGCDHACMRTAWLALRRLWPCAHLPAPAVTRFSLVTGYGHRVAMPGQRRPWLFSPSTLLAAQCAVARAAVRCRPAVSRARRGAKCSFAMCWMQEWWQAKHLFPLPAKRGTFPFNYQGLRCGSVICSASFLAATIRKSPCNTQHVERLNAIPGAGLREG